MDTQIDKRIIFLDIDGVMNSEMDFLLNPDQPEVAYEISPRCIKLLNSLIQDTDARIVISSVWRFHGLDFIKNIFVKNGFEYPDNLIDVTPRLGNGCVRGNEILKWIKDNEKLLGYPYYHFNTYIIFDDDSDMLYWQRNNFIHVDGYTGLTPRAIYKAKWMLNQFKNTKDDKKDFPVLAETS